MGSCPGHIHDFAQNQPQEFTPGVMGKDKDDEDSEEECSDTETIESLGELSLVEFPEDQTPEPVCESQYDQKLLQLAQQFLNAKKAQQGTPENGQGKHENVKCVEKPKSSVVLPSFVSCLKHCCLWCF